MAFSKRCRCMAFPDKLLAMMASITRKETGAWTCLKCVCLEPARTKLARHCRTVIRHA